jgi:pimeloyl-ACP methyl ester carboxylesterase
MKNRKRSDPALTTVTASGETLYVHKCGQGPRLILLHGGPGLDHQLVLPLAEQLSEQYEVWSPDLPGHGSSRMEGEPFPRLGVLLDRLGRWLDGVEESPYILAGHSLGAWLAREYVRLHSPGLTGLVLISPPSRPGRGESAPVRARADAVHPDRFTGGEPGADQQARNELLLFLQLATPGGLSERFRKAAEDTRLNPPWKYGRLVRRLHKELLRPGIEVDPGCPALILGGDMDPITTPEQAKNVARFTVGGEYRSVSGKGHFPWADGSDDAAKQILMFLRENNS